MDSVEGKRKSDICQPCQEIDECTSTKADGFCRDCKEYMCRTCFHHHLRAKYCRTHVLIDLSKAEGTNTSSGDVERCEKHQNETVRFYCRKHDQVGCGDCMLFDGHSSCHPEYIKDVSINFQQKEEFKHLKKKLETLESDNNSLVISIQRHTKSNNEMKTQLKDDVKTFRNNINEYLDKAQTDCLSSANRTHSKNNNVLKQLKVDCQGIHSEIKEQKQKIDCDRNPDHVLFISSVIVKSKLQPIEDAINKNSSSCKIDHLWFKPGKQLCEIVKTSEKFGCFELVPHRKVVEESSGNFWIYVTLQSPCQTETYFIDPNATISALKAMIYKKGGIPVDIEKMKLKLPLLGKILEDKLRISDYGIHSGNTLNCFWSGMDHQK